MYLQFRALVACLVISIAAMAPVNAADVPQRSLLAAWKGRTVVLRQRLYTLVYNERGRLGKTYANRREGLMVLTPSEGAYLKFDGRQHRQDVIQRDPNLMTAAVAREYEGDPLDVRTYSRLEPVVLVQYDPGVDFVITEVDIELDTVKLTLTQAVGPEKSGDALTSITVKWPVPFSKTFLEREQVEQMLRLYLADAPTQ
jgi:hypothetical protein